MANELTGVLTFIFMTPYSWVIRGRKVCGFKYMYLFNKIL